MKPLATYLATCAACVLLAASPVAADEPAQQLDPTTLARLSNNNGVTLQWIGWEDRGIARVRTGSDGVVYLSGGQIAPDGPGTVWLDGKIIEAGGDYFIFEGLIRIANTPDDGRTCEANKRWHFAITQNRRYYRLREFEWCDGLTDYIDIYF